MNEDALRAIRGFAFLAILTVFCCAFRRFLACCDDDNITNDHDGNKAADMNLPVLRSIPIVSFNSLDFKDSSVECVVCLSELVDGDKAKVLPSCNHCFHAVCIDTWLRSDSTCPICRNKVVPINEVPLSTNADAGEVYEVRRDYIPAVVVIDIPAEPEIGESGLIKASES